MTPERRETIVLLILRRVRCMFRRHPQTETTSYAPRLCLIARKCPCGAVKSQRYYRGPFPLPKEIA